MYRPSNRNGLMYKIVLSRYEYLEDGYGQRMSSFTSDVSSPDSWESHVEKSDREDVRKGDGRSNRKPLKVRERVRGTRSYEEERKGQERLRDGRKVGPRSFGRDYLL